MEKWRADHGSKLISSSTGVFARLRSFRKAPIDQIDTQSPLKFMASQVLLRKYFKRGKQLDMTGRLTDWERSISSSRPTVLTTLRAHPCLWWNFQRFYHWTKWPDKPPLSFVRFHRSYVNIDFLSKIWNLELSPEWEKIELRRKVLWHSYSN